MLVNFNFKLFVCFILSSSESVRMLSYSLVLDLCLTVFVRCCNGVDVVSGGCKTSGNVSFSGVVVVQSV